MKAVPHEGEHHSPLDLDGDGQVSGAELVVSTAVGVVSLGLGFLVGIVALAICGG